MSAYTATPWRLHEVFGADIYSDARGGWFVGTTSANGHSGGPGDDTFGQDRIDAAHIVRCVNAHDELVAALREARCASGGVLLASHCKQIDAVLAKLEAS